MNPVDVTVLILLALGVVAGVRAGFFGPVGGLVGAALGFAVALLLASAFRDQLATIEQPLRAILTFAGLAAFVLVGEAAGSTAGGSLSRGIRRTGLLPLDALGGGMVGAAHVVLLVWLVGGMLAAGLFPGIAATARESVALRAVENTLPSPTVVAGRLLTLLDTTGLPPLFAGLEPDPAPPVEVPADADVRALANSAIASTARISSTGCGAGVAVGSGFFVSSTHVITNAHVVAGSVDTTVTIGGSMHVATVVAFDPDVDLALLHVPTGSSPALQLSPEPPHRGATGAAIGYPGGGDLTVAPAAVTASYRIGGPNIYGDGMVDRSVVEMQTQIRPGNSGGPLVVAPATVAGVVFGASRTSPDVGYAIGADQALASIGRFIGSTAPVGTGACL
jgi:S1-C subfamily serine protease